jgi:hypothetical protein
MKQKLNILLRINHKILEYILYIRRGVNRGNVGLPQRLMGEMGILVKYTQKQDGSGQWTHGGMMKTIAANKILEYDYDDIDKCIMFCIYTHAQALHK